MVEGRSFEERARLHRAHRLNYFARQASELEDAIGQMGQCGALRFRPRGEYREQVRKYKAHTAKLATKIEELCIAAREDDTEDSSEESTEATITDATSSESTEATSSESTEATSSESTEAAEADSRDEVESTEATSSQSTDDSC